MARSNEIRGFVFVISCSWDIMDFRVLITDHFYQLFVVLKCLNIGYNMAA